MVSCSPQSALETKFTHKKSHRADAEIDRAALNVRRHSSKSYDIVDFSPYGYDERQFCSPGFTFLSVVS